jgi:hypothetical protein
MPIVEDEGSASTGFMNNKTPDISYEPEFWHDIVPAAYRLENTIGSLTATSALDGPSPNVDPNIPFDPYDHVREGDINELSRYADVDDAKGLQTLWARIDQERKDRETITAGGGYGTAGAMMMAVLDPVNLIPVGGTLFKGYRAGDSILKSAASVGMAGFLGTTAQETVLQATQLTRTGGESAMNIAAGTIFSGILGGGAGGVFHAMRSAGGRSASDVISQIDHDMTIPEGGSGGAAAVRDLDAVSRQQISDEVDKLVADGILAEGAENKEIAARVATELLQREGMQKNWAVDAALKVVGRQDPGIRMQNSSSIETRAIFAELAESALNLGKNAHGGTTPLSVEAIAKDWDGMLYTTLAGHDDDFVQYVKGRSKKFGDIAAIGVSNLIGQGGQKLNRKQFNEFVAKAMIRGDDASTIPGVPTEAVAHINASAARFRSQIIDPMTKKAIELKMLPEDVSVDTAASYFMRVYDIDKLTQSTSHRNDFLETTKKWLINRQKDAKDRTKTFEADVVRLREEVDALRQDIKAAKKANASVKELNKTLRKKAKELKDRPKLHARDLKEDNLFDGDMADTANQILGRIVGTPAGRMPYDVAPQKIDGGSGGQRLGTAAPLHKRAFGIPDLLIEDALVMDAEQVMKMYVRSMSSDLALVEKFGSIEMIDQVKKIQEDYTKLKRDASDDKALQKLAKEEERDIRDLMAIRDRIRHTEGLPDDPTAWTSKMGKGLLQFNYITKLGGMTASAIPDMARPVMVHGITRVLGDGILPLMTAFSSIGKLTKQLRAMGLASDMQNNSRMNSIADTVFEDYSRGTRLEKAMGASANSFGMVSLMAPWNTMFKQFSAVVAMNRTIDAITKEVAGSLGKKESEFLRSSLISPEMGKKIHGQLEQFNEVEKGVTLPNVQNWTDPEAARMFRASLRRSTDITIVTPGAADRPIMATSSLPGRLIFQFKSFAMSATSRILLSGLQQADMAALNGAVMATFLGMAATSFKMWDAGRGEELKDWTAGKWITEGVDRSGLTGIMFDANNIVEKASRGTLGFSAFTGGQQSSRYASRNVMGAILGPSFGTAVTAASSVGNAAAAAFGDDTVKASDTHAVRRLIPYNNLILWRQGFDKAEEGINNSLGIR